MRFLISRLDVDETLVEAFVKHIDYFKGDISNPEAYQALRTQLSESSRYPENRMSAPFDYPRFI